VDVVRAFYQPFAEEVRKAEESMPELRAEPEQLARVCPECGHALLIRHGRFGKFIGCSNFPTCRYTEPWLERIGIRCPADGGELVERRTRRGRVFFGCENYPECGFTTWKRPLAPACPACGGLLVAHPRGLARCLACEREYSLADLSQAESTTDLA
jgi:DNA topoisomerase I